MIEFYRAQIDEPDNKITFEMCEKIIRKMPDMRDAREMFSTFYPVNHPEHDNKIRNAIEENILLRLTLFSHFYFYNDRCTDEWQIQATKKEIELLEFIYDDGNFGKLWRMIMNLYGNLGVSYFKVGDNENAISAFEKSAELAKKFDSLERNTVMHSVLFEGKTFDKHTLGSTFVAKSRVKALMCREYPLSDEFKSTSEFKAVISLLDNG